MSSLATWLPAFYFSCCWGHQLWAGTSWSCFLSVRLKMPAEMCQAFAHANPGGWGYTLRCNSNIRVQEMMGAGNVQKCLFFCPSGTQCEAYSLWLLGESQGDEAPIALMKHYVLAFFSAWFSLPKPPDLRPCSLGPLPKINECLQLLTVGLLFFWGGGRDSNYL